jgi:hypothetical protein
LPGSPRESLLGRAQRGRGAKEKERLTPAAAIKAFTTERNRTPDLKVMPGRVQCEEDAIREQLREDWEYENDTGLWPQW